MKLVVLALVLLFTVGDCLQCNRCLSKRPGESCEMTVETCKPEKEGCVAVKFTQPPHGQYLKCMALKDCELLKLNAYINVNCCSTDSCNTFESL